MQLPAHCKGIWNWREDNLGNLNLVFRLPFFIIYKRVKKQLSILQQLPVSKLIALEIHIHKWDKVLLSNLFALHN